MFLQLLILLVSSFFISSFDTYLLEEPLITITAIKNGGYATSPTYVNTIMSIIKKFDLTRYDGARVEDEYYPVPSIRTSSIVAALNNIRVPSTKDYRKK